MFGSAPYETMTRKQEKCWEAFKENLLAEAASQANNEDPFLYHGTSALKAALIMEYGFQTSWGGVFWGKGPLAMNFARACSFRSDDHGAVVTAKLSDILESGIPQPDINWGVEPEPTTWQESLREVNAIFVRGCSRVKKYAGFVSGLFSTSPSSTSTP